MSLQQFEWTVSGDSNIAKKWIKMNIAVDALVRTEPDYTGKYLWTFGKVCDHADTVEEAKEMVEGLAVAHHLEIIG